MIFLLLLATVASAQTYITTSFYGTDPNVMRVELAAKFPSCQETKLARKIFHHKTNELREIAVFRANGKLEEAGSDNKPKLREEVEAIFAQKAVSENPCFKKTDETSGTKKVLPQ